MPASEKCSHWLRDTVTALGVAVFFAACFELLRADLETLGLVGACLLLIALFGRMSLRMPRRGVVLSVSEPLVFGVLIFLGPFPAAFLAGLDGLLSSARHTRRLRLRLANGAMMGLSLGIAAFVFEALAPTGFRSAGTHAENLVTATMMACLAFFAVNSGVVAGADALAKGKPFWRAWRETSWTLLSCTFSAGTALLAWMLHARWGNLALAVGLPALAVVYFVVWTQFEKIAVHERHHAELQNLHQRTMEAFALAIDTRHPRSRGHARRVQAYAEEVARRHIAGAADGSVRRLGTSWLASLSAAALLHDIGKLGVPDQLLSKPPEELSERETERLRRHPAIGAAILGGIPFPFPLGKAIRHHHERWDGLGYPDGLRDEQIPLAARLIALADTLDHLHITYVGPEHRRLETMRLRMAELAGRQLDPTLVEIYCDQAAEIEEAVAARISADGPTQETSQETEALEDIDRAQKEAGVLYDLARQVGSTLDLQDTAITVLHRLVELMPATSACLYVYDDQARMLLPQAAIGPLSDILDIRRFAPGEGTIGWCYETGEPLLDADPRVDLGRQVASGERPPVSRRSSPLPTRRAPAA
ncbi:MAG: HD domain-containing phosphohydrolase [Acidobacteriota bacterium]|nr:HD domain-containing phosphohydrolase [Acidobacteriota bacterium]